MLLRALATYYDRLASAPDTKDLPAYGFSREKISFCIVLAPDGSLQSVEDLRLATRGRSQPALLLVPDRGGRSGTRTKPNFLWDNTGYVLGADGKGRPRRTSQTFGAFRLFHHELAQLVGPDSEYTAVLRFLDAWEPARALTLPLWSEMRDRNLVFRMTGQMHFVHERPPVRSAWLELRNRESQEATGQCLVTGAPGRLARLHDQLTGLPGAQSSGAAIVSFNKESFTSYGREQSLNAPVAVETVFKYTTALSRLVLDRRHRVSVSKDTILFWTDRPSPLEEFFGPAIEGFSAEDTGLRDRLGIFFQRVRSGKPPHDEPAADDTRFCVVGISPNAARLAVRFWCDTTVADLCARLGEHARDLAISQDDDIPLALRNLIAETARDPKDAPPLLAGALLRAILTGTPYPEGLYTAVLRRIRADGHVDQARAAILKAYLVRRARHAHVSMEVPVSLDPNHPDAAYQLGRLFAVFEKSQKDALGEKVNATIKDRFFGAASATPAAVFPRLVRLNQHHLSSIDNAGYRTAHEKRIGEICDRLPTSGFPSHLTLHEQGLFAIAYYQQTRALYQRRDPSAAESPKE